MNMKKRFIPLIPYAIVLAVNFYLLPCLIRDTGMAMVMMLCVIPLITFVCGVICGVRQGFALFLPLLTMVLFFPTVFIYYNITAWVYIPVYGIITLAGNGFGRIFYKKR